MPHEAEKHTNAPRSLRRPTPLLIAFSRQRSPHLRHDHPPVGCCLKHQQNIILVAITLYILQQRPRLSSLENEYEDITVVIRQSFKVFGEPEYRFVLGCLLPNDSRDFLPWGGFPSRVFPETRKVKAAKMIHRSGFTPYPCCRYNQLGHSVTGYAPECVVECNVESFYVGTVFGSSHIESICLR